LFHQRQGRGFGFNFVWQTRDSKELQARLLARAHLSDFPSLACASRLRAVFFLSVAALDPLSSTGLEERSIKFCLDGRQNTLDSKENGVDLARHNREQPSLSMNGAASVFVHSNMLCLDRKLRPYVFENIPKVWYVSTDLIFHLNTFLGY
jgi:hypothetical protein